MFKSIAFVCLLGLAAAGHPGYNYQNLDISAPHQTGSGNVKSIDGHQAAPVYSQSFGGHSGSTGHQVGGHSGSTGHHQTPLGHPEAQLEKSFYYFSAPEEEFDQSDALRKLMSTLKKSVRVIFIKAPENRAYENALLNLAKNAIEQKTHIYLLSKQPDIAGLAEKFRAAQASGVQHKPEVHFVKYRTSDDARHAQEAIQAQYNQLGGGRGTHVDGGVAPVLNFASGKQGSFAPSSGSSSGFSSGSSISGGHPDNVSRAYLAPSVDKTNTNRAYLAPDAPVEKNYAKRFLPQGVDVVPGSSYIPLAVRLYRRK